MGVLFGAALEEKGAELDTLDQPAIGEIARSTDAPWLVREAIARLTNQAVLAEIARSDRSGRFAAADRLTDPVWLEDLARNAKDEHVRRNVVHRIQDQPTLGRLARTAFDEHVRWHATQVVEDQAVLKEILTEDGTHPARAAAARHLSDAVLLGRLATSDQDHQVRAAAVSNPNLTDQAIFETVARNVAEHFCARRSAILRLENQAVLADLARHGDDGTVRSEAIGRLNDRAALEDVARDPDASIRVTAVRRGDLPGPSLVNLATNDPSDRVRIEATLRIHDKSALAKLARSSKHADVRAAAVSGASDKVCTEIAQRDPNARVRREALRSGWGRIDQAVLAELAQHDKSALVRVAATRQLRDARLLAAIGTTDEHNTVRRAAQQRIGEAEVLTGLARAIDPKPAIAEIRSYCEEQGLTRAASLLAEAMRCLPRSPEKGR